MADIAFGSVGKIVEIALKIKEAVETVKQNHKECRDIHRCVTRVTALIKRLDEVTETMKDDVMRDALEDLAESLQGALDLVIKCQRKHVVLRFIGATDMAKELRRAQEDILSKVTIGNFAANVLQISITLQIPVAQDVGMDKPSHGSHPNVDASSEKEKTKVATGSGVSFDPLYGLTKFTLSELEAATDNFSEKYKIGQGGSSVVFKGVLRSGLVVAIKEFHGILESKSLHEISNTGVKLQHKNVVETLGYCVADQEKRLMHDGKSVVARTCRRMLVMRYMPNGSLADTFIRGTHRIYWSTCFRIIEGIAQGLHYLHEQNVVHLDLKPDNILFDSDMNPVIVDFNLSKAMEKNGERSSMALVGTLGYLPPEYIAMGKVSTRADVFAFGVVLLRTIASACTKVKPGRHFTPEEWDGVLQEHALRELFDPTLVEESQLMEIERCVNIGLLCVEYDRNVRPTMAEVLEMLNGKKELPARKKRSTRYTEEEDASDETPEVHA